MADLRSTQFYEGVITTAAVNTVYTVPSNHRIALRGIQAWNTLSTSNRLYWGYGAGNWLGTADLAGGGGTAATLNEVLWSLFNEGETIALGLLSTGAVRVRLSGSLFYINPP